MSLWSVPLKTIVIWYSSAPAGTTLPSGYALCNGQTLTSANQDIITGGSFTLPNMADPGSNLKYIMKVKY